MNIPLVDLKKQYDLIKPEIDNAIKRVIESGNFILGDEVKEFENAVAKYCGTKYAVGVASGTDALHIAILACGIKEGDEIITTPFTFIATTEAIRKCGAIPVFVDIDPKTYNIDPQKIKAKINRKTRAILPVHVYGQAAIMHIIMALAKNYNLKVIEDCAQAFGAKYDGKIVGSFGDAGCLSFFPSKILGAYGDAGMIITNDSKVAEMAITLRSHGSKNKYYNSTSGFNSRLDAIQAAILGVKLKYINRWIEKRRLNADIYSMFLKDVKGIILPSQTMHNYHVFNYYTIRLKKELINRDNVIAELKRQGIGCAVYYPLSLHLQAVYKDLGYKKGEFPESELAQDEVLSLPMYAELNAEQIKTIAECLIGAIK